MSLNGKKIAVLSPVAWRTPPREYGAWETVASNITEGLAKRGWHVTLFATKDSVTAARLHAVIDRGWEEDRTVEPKVCECLHISEVMERSHKFDLIHNNFDFLPLTYSRLVKTPILTTIHGFSSPEILKVYRKYRNNYYVSISDADRDPHLKYLATVYNGIDLTNITFRPAGGEKLVFLGRIHPDKGTHLAIRLAQNVGKKLVIAGIIQDRRYFDNFIKPALSDPNIEYIGPVGPQQRDQLFVEALTLIHLNTIPERFGLVMAEAMAAGVPVIANDLGSCREVIVDGETGILVTNNDLDQAAQAVRDIVNIDRGQCRKHVENNFTIDKMVQAYETVYQQIFELEKAKG